MDKKILFIVNPGSGSNSTDWPNIIYSFFEPLRYTIEIFTLPKDCNLQIIQEQINSLKPDIVVATGGDGTVKLVAECILNTEMLLGILPAGSANGLAKELGISEKPAEALKVLVTGLTKKIHLTKVNEELCIHLSDIGFNAYMIKTFESSDKRGMMGYLKASFKTLFTHRRMNVSMQVDGSNIRIQAAMIVIANATRYGSGAVINPLGKIDDLFFEVVAIKKISLFELFKMTVTHAAFDPEKTALYQTNNLLITSKRKVHFQVDGEYLGRIREIKASIIPAALQVIMPA